MVKTGPEYLWEDVTITLGTLAALDLIAATSGVLDGATEQGFRVFDGSFAADLDGKTTAEGPVVVGLSLNLSGSNIESIMEAKPGSKFEVINTFPGSWIRPLWMLHRSATAGMLSLDGNARAIGTFMHIPKIQWSIPEGEFATWWAYNLFGSALTTGTTIRIFGSYYGVWLND